MGCLERGVAGRINPLIDEVGLIFIKALSNPVGNPSPTVGISNVQLRTHPQPHSEDQNTEVTGLPLPKSASVSAINSRRSRMFAKKLPTAVGALLFSFFLLLLSV